MKKSFIQRLNFGKSFEDEMFNPLQNINEIKHSSDRVIWIKNRPIFIEIKSSIFMEWESWLDQNRIHDLGFDLAIIAKDKKNRCIKADWIQNISNNGRQTGTQGSYNDYTVLFINKTLNVFLEELKLL